MKNLFKQLFAFLWIKNQQGAVALLVLLILSALAMVIMSGVVFMGMGDLELGFSQQSGGDVVLSAESCVEEALIRLSRNASYSGGSLTVGQSTCTISVTGTPCGTCTVTAEATANRYTRKIQAGVIVAGSAVDLTSWEEI